VWLVAGAKHYAFYPGGIVPGSVRELKDFDTSKGTIRFQPDRPLPAALVRKLVNARIARVGARRQRAKVAPRRARRV